jgi:hypothetical protein
MGYIANYLIDLENLIMKKGGVYLRTEQLDTHRFLQRNIFTPYLRKKLNHHNCS